MHPRRLAHLSLRLTLGVNIAVHGLVRFLELAVGLAVLLGVRLMHALFCGALLMTALTFGTCLRQDWPGAGRKRCYAVAYAILLFTLEHAHWTLTKREASWTSN